MNRIILPLDNLSWSETKPILEKTQGLVWGYKLRKVILEKSIGIIDRIKDYGNVMIDFKLYDIPMAITESLHEHFDCGALISTVHCTAQYEPNGTLDPVGIVGVTILTSFSDEQFKKYYKGPEIIDTVREMVWFAKNNKYGYIVCSPLELEFLKDIKIIKICPGIRPLWYDKSDDQRRVSTPSYAIKNGAGLLVIGRPLLNVPNIKEAIYKTNLEISKALTERSDYVKDNSQMGIR